MSWLHLQQYSSEIHRIFWAENIISFSSPKELTKRAEGENASESAISKLIQISNLNSK